MTNIVILCLDCKRVMEYLDWYVNGEVIRYKCPNCGSKIDACHVPHVTIKEKKSST